MIKASTQTFSSSRASGGSLFVKTMYCGLITSLALVGACQPKPVAQAPEAQAKASAVQMDARVAEPAPAKTAPAAPAPPASQRQPAAKTQTGKAGESAAAGQAASITGGWVNAGGACDSGASVQFNSDGTYMSEGENGTWALDGKTLTVTTAATPEAEKIVQAGPEQSTGDSGEKAILTVLNVTDTSANVILSNGTNARWTRCSG
jgi:hypothetical protein